MPLIKCPECGREISTAAEACPQCGHPNFAARQTPICYACPAPATTRCQCCGKLSCAEHVDNILVPHGRGGAYELRCRNCYAKAAEAKRNSGAMIAGVFAAAAVAAVVIFIANSSSKKQKPPSHAWDNTIIDPLTAPGEESGTWATYMMKEPSQTEAADPPAADRKATDAGAAKSGGDRPAPFGSPHGEQPSP